MKSLVPTEVARASRGLHGALGPIKTRLVLALTAVRAWRWGAVFGRIFMAGLGLVLLGAIGHSARARSMLSTDVPPPADAGAPIAPSGIAVATLAAAAPPEAPPTPAPAPPPVATTTAPSALGRATPDDPVYLNQATAADLHRLPGVGPKRAEAILTLRNRLGHFRQIEDLLKVKGIGRSSLRKLRPLVRLDPPPAKITDAGTADAAMIRPP